jgi:parvulin-like peptidyl-prolyl isomerase
MRAVVPIGALAALCLSLIGVGCGGSDSSQPAAHVGGQAISKVSVTHWASVLNGSPSASAPAHGRQLQLEHEALSLLITYQWLIGEATRHVVPISSVELRQRIDQILGRSFPGGSAELREFLKPTGERLADVELQARAEISLAALRRIALARASAPSAAELAAYYAQHKQSFVLPGHREAHFTNRKTEAAALQVKREVLDKKRALTSAKQRKVGEILTGAQVPPGNEYERAIDAATPHRVSGPYKIGNDYWLYEVEKIIRPRRQSFAEVRSAIARTLTEQRRRQALTVFAEQWSSYWRARTDCIAGFQVQGCRGYRGSVSSKATLPQL